MRSIAICVGFLIVITAPPLRAQWLHYPTAGVPKIAAGAPDLNAPAPRTREGKPDLSGIWSPEKNRPCPPEGCDDMVIPYEFLDIGWSLKGGLHQPWAAAAVKARRATSGTEDPTTHCLPGGIVKMYTTPLLHKIVETPGLMLMLGERDASYRQIFLDGRALPADPQPSWNGYSSGQWDGDTLVVETNGFRDGLWLDRGGSPLTDSAKMTERLRRVNFGTLEIEITVNDPKAYTRPWTVKLNQLIVLDTELLDYICLENEKDLAHLGTK